MTVGNPPPKDVLRELDKLANSRLLSEFSRISGVSLPTLGNIRRGKHVTEDTLEKLRRGISKRVQASVPQRPVDAPVSRHEPIARGRLQAGVVLLVVQLGELTAENRRLVEELAAIRAERDELRTRVREAESITKPDAVTPAEAIEPVTALAEIARLVGPQHDNLMVQLRNRLPKVMADH